MNLKEEQNHHPRLWDRIELKLEYGYFGSYPPIRLTCYEDGMLVFKPDSNWGFMPLEIAIEDRDHSVSNKSLAKLDELVDEIREIECLEGTPMMDGPSFDCYVQLSNGTVTGFHYCSMMLSEKFEEMERRLRKILREDFFLRKYKEKLGFWM